MSRKPSPRGHPMSVIGSIKTNVAANTALLNLENTVTTLQNTQSEISTGLAVSSAKDNASYFSIASVLRSDSSALGNVSDTLNLGDSSLTVASNALANITTTLGDIKNQLVNATAPGADMKVIQQQITQDQAQLTAAAQSANFNGQNFLSVDSSATGYNSTKSFVSSYSRDSTGAISVGFINIDTSNTALFDANTTGYDPTTKGAITTTLTASTAAAAPPAGVAGANTFTATAANGQLQITSYTQSNGGANYYANTINIGNVSTANGTPAVTETAGTGTALGGLTQAAIGAGDTVGGIATGTMAGTAAPAYDSTNHTLTFYVLENDSANPGQYAYNKYVVNNFTPSTGKGYLDSVDATTSGSYTDASGNVTNTAPGGTGVSIAGANGIDISNFTDSPADMAKLNALEKQVDAAISNVASSAATLGAGQARIESQQSFVTSLQTSINDGVGGLVDADLNLVSTRLQALQVQQQLGVQSLSIANQSSQMILKLFG